MRFFKKKEEFEVKDVNPQIDDEIAKHEEADRRRREREAKDIGVMIDKHRKEFPCGCQITILGKDMIILEIYSNYPARGMTAKLGYFLENGRHSTLKVPLDVVLKRRSSVFLVETPGDISA